MTTLAHTGPTEGCDFDGINGESGRKDFVQRASNKLMERCHVNDLHASDKLHSKREMA